MKYMRIFAALAVFCLLAAPAFSAQAGNVPVKNVNKESNCVQNCIGPNDDANAYQTGPQNGSGNQNGNGQNGNLQGDQEGTGPERDGSCVV